MAKIVEQEDQFCLRDAQVAEATALVAQLRSESEGQSAGLRQAKLDFHLLHQRFLQSKTRLSAARLKLARVEKRLAEHVGRSRLLRRNLRAKRLKISAIQSSWGWGVVQALEAILSFAGKCFVAPLRLFAARRQ